MTILRDIRVLHVPICQSIYHNLIGHSIYQFQLVIRQAPRLVAAIGPSHYFEQEGMEEELPNLDQCSLAEPPANHQHPQSDSVDRLQADGLHLDVDCHWGEWGLDH